MTTAAGHHPARYPTSPAGLGRAGLGYVGRSAITVAEYLGVMALLLATGLRTAGRLGPFSSGMRAAVAHELSWMILMGLPMVALACAGMGSFLSMQAYFGGTFVDGTGAVVGVGLIRNLGPMMAGLTLSGLFAARITPGFRIRHEGQSPRGGFLERTATEAATAPRRPTPEPDVTPADRLVAARLFSGAVCGFVMSVWGSAVGTVVGWKIAGTMMGVSTSSFFLMFFDMIWARDIVGLIVRGPLYGLIAALIACHEGLWREGVGHTTTATGRAACLSVLATLVIGSGWFVVFYHAGTAFGPTLLTPPSS